MLQIKTKNLKKKKKLQITNCKITDFKLGDEIRKSKFKENMKNKTFISKDKKKDLSLDVFWTHSFPGLWEGERKWACVNAINIVECLIFNISDVSDSYLQSNVNHIKEKMKQ